MCTVFVTHVRNYIMGATPEIKKQKHFPSTQVYNLHGRPLETLISLPEHFPLARTYIHGCESLKMYTHHKLAVILF